MKEEKKYNIQFIIIAIICISLFMVAIVQKELQNDTFYTIKLGELILNNGIDMQEHFAWHEGLPYTYPHWAYDVMIYFIYALGGFNGIYISSIILGIVLAITIYLTNVKLTKSTVIPFFTTVLIIYIGKDFITARAQLVTFILFVLTIYLIEKFLETKKKRYAVGLIIVPILIANFHAAVFPFYFVLYLPYIGEWFVSFFLSNTDLITKILLKSDEIEIKKLEKKENLTQKQQEKLALFKTRVEKNKVRLEEKKNTVKEPYKIIVENNKNVIWLMVIMVIAVLTGLLTPIGDTPYTYLLHTMQGNTTQNISEHLPIILYNSKFILAYMVIAICLISFTKVKLKLSDIFLLGGLMFLTLMSRRQISLLLFIGILVINKMLAQIIEMYDKNGEREILKYLTSVVAQIIFFSVFAAFMIFQLKQTKDEEIVSSTHYPVEAADFVVNNLDLKKIRLFNEYNFGSYLLYRGIPVFIDSRADVYDPQFNGWEDDIFRDFMNITNANGDYEEKLDHYGITHLFIYSNSTLSKILQKDAQYLELYKDSNFVVYERLNG